MDGGWLEMSTDGGFGWQKVGALGLDWYNATSPQWGDLWSGSSGGWVYQYALLPGTAGELDVRLRFVFMSDSSYSFEGIAIDDVVVDELMNPYYDPPEDPPSGSGGGGYGGSGYGGSGYGGGGYGGGGFGGGGYGGGGYGGGGYGGGSFIEGPSPT